MDEGCLAGLGKNLSLQPQHTQHKSLRPAPQLQGLVARRGVGGGFHAGFTFKILGGLTSRPEVPGKRFAGFHKQQKRSEENTVRGWVSNNRGRECKKEFLV
jgi:hypothetical protein